MEGSFTYLQNTHAIINSNMTSAIFDLILQNYWKTRTGMMPTILSLVALQVVIMTTCSATSYNKVAIMTTHSF